MKRGTYETKKGKTTFSKKSWAERRAADRQAKRDFKINKLKLETQQKATNAKAETIKAVGGAIAKNIGSLGRATGTAVASTVASQGLINNMPNTSGYKEVLDPVIKEGSEKNDSSLLVP